MTRDAITIWRGCFGLVILVGLPSSFSDVIRSYDNCATNSIPDTTPIESINDSTFVKLCVGLNNDDNDDVEDTLLDKPMCGNGEEFNFYMLKPDAEYANDANLLIEFVGGGACWSGESCIGRDDLLAFPTDDFDRFLGFDCDTIKSFLSVFGFEANALCNEQIGENLNLSEYNYLVMPYCTQDLHMGDSIVEFTEDRAPPTVRFHGAHNMMAMLNYVFDNFPDVENIVLTGCSAGANALGAAHSLIRKHYGNDSVRIDVLMDSPTFLSTEEFQKDHFPIWNMETISTLMGFEYDVYKESKDYFLYSFLDVMAEGMSSGDIASCDHFGAIQHSRDPVALDYWESVGGGSVYDEWWEEQSRVFNELESAGNFQAFVMENEEGHCNFGLYYPLAEVGFGNYVDSVIQTQCVISLPSDSPTILPTENPASTFIPPTTSPTLSLTSVPTDTPTKLILTDVPSHTPTYSIDTLQPSSVTISPTSLPTITSTSAPTDTPTKLILTDIPSHTPTYSKDTLQPSSVTISPTSLPTITSTSAPTDTPTKLILTEVPSDTPTYTKETLQPSSVTISPTSPPTIVSSSSPTDTPTKLILTNTPSQGSTSTKDTLEPSFVKSSPTFTPTITVPTDTPNKLALIRIPSHTPSIMPSLNDNTASPIMPSDNTNTPTLSLSNPTSSTGVFFVPMITWVTFIGFSAFFAIL